MLFNEPKLLKLLRRPRRRRLITRFSALQRAEIAEIMRRREASGRVPGVSVLFNEPKLLKSYSLGYGVLPFAVSVLFNEPKLLKFYPPGTSTVYGY